MEKDLNKILELIDTNPDWTPDEKAKLKNWFSGLTSPASLGEEWAKLVQARGGKTLLQLRENQVKLKQLSDGIWATMSTAIDFNDISNSKDMIRRANKALKNLKRPALPSTTPDSRLLKENLSRAQRDAANAGMLESEMVKRGIDESFEIDRAASRVASTGQAGNYAANVQAAINRRNKALGRVPAVALATRRAAEQRVDNLTAQQIAEDQRRFDQEMQLTGIAENRYNQDRYFADKLGMQGRQSLRNAGENLAGSMSQFIPRAFNSDAIEGIVGGIRSGFDRLAANRAARDPYSVTGDIIQDGNDFESRVYEMFNNDPDNMYNLIERGY